MMNRILLWVLVLFSVNVFAQSTDSLIVDKGCKDDLLNLLQQLADKEDNWLLKRHFQSMIMVMNKPDAEYSDDMLEKTMETLDFMRHNGQYLDTYIEQDVRPLIMAYVSPTDSAVSFYRLTLPKGWDEHRTDYPMYIELHGSGGGQNNNPLRICLMQLGPEPSTGMAPQHRRDGYHLYPWGRGDKGYRESAEADVWECLADFDAMFKTDPDRQYMYGFSMGGAGTSGIAWKAIDRWAAIGCYSGFAQLTPEMTELYAKIPVWMAWGDQETRALNAGKEMRDMLLEAGGTVRWHEVKDTGHKYLGEYQWDMLDFFRDNPKKHD